MTIIYFIRHGQTDWNVEGRMQGQTDIPINSIGRQQARHNGITLASLIDNPDEWNFVASPLSRTSETMEIIRETMGLPRSGYATDDRLKEIHFGNWQGFTWNEIQTKAPEKVAERKANHWNFQTPGVHGESYAMLSTRVLNWLSEINHNTICVSHGGINRCLQKHFRNLSESEASAISKVPQDKVMKISDGNIEWK